MFWGLAENWLKIVVLFLVSFAISQAGDVWAQPQSPFLEFIYIDATAGEAAAGHSAVKLGETVFHYQFHADGRLLLTKQNWEDFRYYYNYLSNRSLKIATIPLSQLAYSAINQSFHEKYLKQQIDFGRLKNLQNEDELYVNLVQGDNQIEINGVGLFSTLPYTGGQHVRELKKHVGESLGRFFLIQLFWETENQIALITKALFLTSDEEHIPLALQKHELKEVRLKELLALKESLKILIDEKGLKAESIVRSVKTKIPLKPMQLIQLRDFQQQIFQSIISLLRTDRSDKGPTLLVQIARYQIIGLSLAENELLTLYPYAKHKMQNENTQNMSKEDQHFTFLFNEALFFSERTQKTFFDADQASWSIAYSVLEKARGRLLLYEQAVDDQIPNWRLFPECGLPCLRGQVMLHFSSQKAQYKSAAWQARKVLERYNRQLDKRYGYNLFSKNCSTELVQTVNNAFDGKENIQENLGGYLQAGKGLSHIPFGLHKAILTSFPVRHEENFPAYRLHELARLYKEEGDDVWLRESNTLTSTLYTPWHEDGYFLFFTDNALITRPLLGILNLCYSALHTIGGVITAPIDNGQRFTRGLDGIIFSLPEILFFNIRKGSYQVIAPQN